MFSVKIEVGKVLTLTYPENPSTGYINYIMPSDGLCIVNNQYIPSSNMIGAGGQRVVSYRANYPGIYFIGTMNVRPWMSDVPQVHLSKVEVIPIKNNSSY
jgi:predicted secreted protein